MCTRFILNVNYRRTHFSVAVITGNFRIFVFVVLKAERRYERGNSNPGMTLEELKASVEPG